MSETTVREFETTVHGVELEARLVRHNSWGFGLGGGGSRSRALVAGGVDFGRYGLRLKVVAP